MGGERGAFGLQLTPNILFIPPPTPQAGGGAIHPELVQPASRRPAGWSGPTVRILSRILDVRPEGAQPSRNLILGSWMISNGTRL